MSEIKLLQAPDKSRYTFYRRTPERTLNLDTKFKAAIPPGLDRAKEQAFAEALMKNNFVYLEEFVRKFWDDMNGMKV